MNNLQSSPMYSFPTNESEVNRVGMKSGKLYYLVPTSMKSMRKQVNDVMGLVPLDESCNSLTERLETAKILQELKESNPLVPSRNSGQSNSKNQNLGSYRLRNLVNDYIATPLDGKNYLQSQNLAPTSQGIVTPTSSCNPSPKKRKPTFSVKHSNSTNQHKTSKMRKISSNCASGGETSIPSGNSIEGRMLASRCNKESLQDKVQILKNNNSAASLSYLTSFNKFHPYGNSLFLDRQSIPGSCLSLPNIHPEHIDQSLSPRSTLNIAILRSLCMGVTQLKREDSTSRANKPEEQSREKSSPLKNKIKISTAKMKEVKICRMDECVEAAARRTPYCSKHAGPRKCEWEGCNKCAQGRTRFCISHGGGRRCLFPNCTKGARDKKYCAFHGGGRRCNVEDCSKLAVGGFDRCTAHGGGKRCQSDKCTKSAQSSSNYCVRHGGGRKCNVEKCNKVARGKIGLCMSHSTQQGLGYRKNT